MEETQKLIAPTSTMMWAMKVPQKAWRYVGRGVPEISTRTLLLLSFFFNVYILHMFMTFNTSSESSSARLRLITADTAAEANNGRRRKVYVEGECHLPDPNPFDPIAMQYVHPYQINCTAQPYLSFLDDFGYLHVNESAVELLKKSTEKVNCVYYPITRHETCDFSIRVWKNETLEQGVATLLDVEVVKVVCQDADKHVIYHETMTYPRNMTEQLRRKNKKLVEEGRPSIMLLGFDSTSRLNFMRQLPKTYKFLTETLKSTVFKGHTKSADNTKPNFFAWLTGVTMGPARDDVPGPFWDKEGGKDWSGVEDNIPAPVWWDTVNRQGYITMHIDDSTGHATYSIQPTDYYGMPFYYALDLGDLSDEDITDSMVPNIHGATYFAQDTYCVGNHPVHELHFQYVERFTQKMRDQVYFSLPFLVRLSHEHLNSIKAMDDDLAAMLQRMHSAGDLDNTVLVVFSDHGARIGSLRHTPLGLIECNMPYLSVALPPKLREAKPHLQAGLDSNSERLVSWFDLHELVMDLVMDNLEPESRVTRWAHNGLSPFRDIPRNRTCYDAGIPTEYCVCLSPSVIEVTDDSVKLAAEVLLNHINDLLSPHRPACAMLTLRSVESAELLSHEVDPIKMLRVSFRADPSDAHFQGIVEQGPHDHNGTVIGQVDRLNTYGDHAHCLSPNVHSELKLYCFCQD